MQNTHAFTDSEIIAVDTAIMNSGKKTDPLNIKDLKNMIFFCVE